MAIYIKNDDADLLRQLAVHLIAETPEAKMYEVILELMNQEVIDPHTWGTRAMMWIWDAKRVNAAVLAISSKREGIKKLWIGLCGVAAMGIWDQDRLDKFMRILYNMGWEPNDVLVQYSKDRQNGY